MWIASFDIGIKNFAFAILNIHTTFQSPSRADLYEHFDVIHFENLDLTTPGKKNIRANDMMDIFENLYDVMDGFALFWEGCEVFLIEQQMQFRHASNIKALKLSQHVLSYLLLHQRGKTILEYPAYHKTQVWKAPPKLKKHERKKWAIQIVQGILEQQSNHALLEGLKKKDDVSDCILMGLAYAYTNPPVVPLVPFVRLLPSSSSQEDDPNLKNDILNLSQNDVGLKSDDTLL